MASATGAFLSGLQRAPDAKAISDPIVFALEKVNVILQGVFGVLLDLKSLKAAPGAGAGGGPPPMAYPLQDARPKGKADDHTPALSIAASNVARDLVTAMTAPIAAFNQITGAVSGFVQALNPASALVLDQAMRSLYATVGSALEPIMTVAAGAVQDFASSLAPVMTALRPVVEQLARSFGQMANVFAGAFASILTSLMPAFKMFADIVAALVPVFQAVAAGLAGLVAAFVGGGDWESVTKGLKDSFRSLSSYALQAAANVMLFADSLLGTQLAKRFAEGARRALLSEEDRGTPHMGAPRNAGVGGLANFGQSVTAAALLAGPAGMKTKDDEERQWRENVVKQLDLIASGKQSELGKALDKLAERIVAKLDDIVRNTASKADEVAHGILERSGGAGLSPASVAYGLSKLLGR